MNIIATNEQSGQQNSNTDAHQKACPTIEQITKLIPTVRHFIGKQQLAVMADACRGLERDYFKAKFAEVFQTVTTMPKTYEQDGKGDEATAYLHYFLKDCDWYITKRDMQLDDQRQAFGLAAIWEEELGYICITEIIANGAELDLHWTPKTLREIKREREVERALNDFNSTASHHHY